MLSNDQQQEPSRGSSDREYGHHKLREPSSNQTSHEGPTPDVHRRVSLTPLSDVVTQEDLDREVDEDNEGKLLLLEALIQKLQARNSIVGLESNLGDEVNDDEALDVLQFQDAPHGAVNLSNAIAVLIAVFAFHDCQSKSDYQVCPSPETQVAIKLHDTSFCRSATEPLVRKVFGIEG